MKQYLLKVLVHDAIDLMPVVFLEEFELLVILHFQAFYEQKGHTGIHVNWFGLVCVV